MSAFTVEQKIKLSNFTDLIEPSTLENFIEQYWEKDLLILHRNNPDFYQSLFSIEKVDHVLDVSRPTGKSLRVVKSQEPLLPTKYENHDGSLNLNQLYTAYADGYTIVINELERFWAPLRAFCQNMSNFLSHHTVGNMYLTPKNEKALLPHHDTHDVYVLQIHGKKHWILYDSITETPLLNSPQPVYDRTQLSNPREITLNAGDFMYMPRGVPHEAYTTDESSLHITLGAYPAQWVDLMSHAVQYLAYTDTKMRKALPVGFLNPATWTPEFIAEFKTTFQSFLEKVLQQARPMESISLLGEEFRNKRNPRGDGHFYEIDKIDQLNLDSYLIKRDGLNCNVSVIGQFSRIIFPGNIIKGPAQIAETLQYIANTKDSFVLRDLPTLSDENKIKLAARLIRGGLLRFA